MRSRLTRESMVFGSVSRQTRNIADRGLDTRDLDVGQKRIENAELSTLRLRFDGSGTATKLTK